MNYYNYLPPPQIPYVWVDINGSLAEPQGDIINTGYTPDSVYFEDRSYLQEKATQSGSMFNVVQERFFYVPMMLPPPVMPPPWAYSYPAQMAPANVPLPSAPVVPQTTLPPSAPLTPVLHPSHPSPFAGLNARTSQPSAATAAAAAASSTPMAAAAASTSTPIAAASSYRVSASTLSSSPSARPLLSDDEVAGVAGVLPSKDPYSASKDLVDLLVPTVQSKPSKEAALATFYESAQKGQVTKAERVDYTFRMDEQNVIRHSVPAALLQNLGRTQKIVGEYEEPSNRRKYISILVPCKVQSQKSPFEVKKNSQLLKSNEVKKGMLEIGITYEGKLIHTFLRIYDFNNNHEIKRKLGEDVYGKFVHILQSKSTTTHSDDKRGVAFTVHNEDIE